ncbi:acetyl-CoA acetyltransferase [Geothrix limicola]|uniref:Acetyl-CoA acetyltransferase n=1 Tax=Geothrix limicola TaxID=2927978 RepID=A0ABQ5QBU9_9BACT|nr:thiolase family protein [Geothrix limicola]GLH72294.1 acetyl-CoA acetyltransferase [Geothrix limicola]
MTQAVILKSLRSPIGKFQGALAPLAAPDLAAQVIKALLAAVPGAEPTEAIFGNVVSAGVGQAPARQAALRGGLPSSISALTINKVCGSGLKAIQLAANAVRLADHQVVLAGGMESMSNAPYLMPKLRAGARMGHTEAKDAMILDGLWCAMTDQHMGHTGELVADKYGVGREAQDAWAAESHRKAVAATQSGAFKAEIVPIAVPGKKGDLIVSEDEGPRADSTPESLAKLRPAFKKDGTVTAGNAPSVNDGAAAVLVSTESYAKAHGLPVQARILGTTTAGLDPEWVLMAPVEAIRKLLTQVGWAVSDVDLWEINEAFAVQIVATMNELKIAADRINVHGGAVALGHPIGASGARVMATLIHALERHGKQRGVAALCLGGGNAIAMAVERV